MSHASCASSFGPRRLALGVCDARQEPSLALVSAQSYFKDPQRANDPAVKEYHAALKKYSPESDPEDAFNMYGRTVATTMAKANEEGTGCSRG